MSPPSAASDGVPIDPARRALAASVLLAPLLQACAGRAAMPDFGAIEAGAGGRLGVVAFDGRGARLAYRAQERFPACSTFKALLAAAVLHCSQAEPTLLQQRVAYGAADLHTYAPVTGKHQLTGMTVEELCAAAVQYSDNVAANLLLRLLGGPPALTAYVRTLGDTSFRLDRWEPELNTALPGDLRDTCTPLDIARDLHRLVLGTALAGPQRALLQAWLRGNTTGAARIRAGVPATWAVGDKTGTGDYGTTNDIAVLWPPAGEAFVLAVYFTQDVPDAKPRDEVVAAAARLALAGPGA